MAAAGWRVARNRTDKVEPPVIPGDKGSPVIEVLNGTPIDGLARDVVRQLRRRGIDVVYFGSSPDRRDRDTTLILIRRGDSTSAMAVRKALGVGRLVVQLDPQRLLDATVMLGRDAAGGFHLRP